MAGSSEISFVASTHDRLVHEVSNTDSRLRRIIVSYVGSLTINGLFVLLIILPSIVYERAAETVEIPIEIVAAPPEPPPEVQKPPPPPPPQPVAVESPALRGVEVRDVADKERQQKAEPGKVTRRGGGTAESPTAAQSAAREMRDGEEIDKDPRKEISHLVPPRAKKLEPLKKEKIAPPGPDGKATTKEKPNTETAADATLERRPLQCGANARMPTKAAPSVPRTRAQVLGIMTRDQGLRLEQLNEVLLDLYISPGYLEYVRVAIHVDGAPPHSWTAAVLSPGVNVQAGDHVEIVKHRLDSARPCHYIPIIVSRVL